MTDQLMTKALSLAKNFCAFFFEERNYTKAVALLSQDICWFGTSDFEDVHSLSEAKEFIKKDIAAIPSHYSVDCTEEYLVPAGDGGVASLRLHIADRDAVFCVRVTAVTKLEEGIEKLCSMHFSAPDSREIEKQYFAPEAYKTAIERTKEELVYSTMVGGVLACYFTEGYPFFFINPRLLSWLGYDNEEEYRKAINDLIITQIHPDDRNLTVLSTKRQLALSDHYSVEYRMRKKDGSYIWIRDIGKESMAPDGQKILICACYDTTESHEKQAQLDNLINAIPGGVALFQLKKSKIELIYKTARLSALSGCTPEEYERLFGAEAESSLYPGDRDRVYTALFEAASTEKTVSLDYRIQHKNGHFIWISANFRRTGAQNGDPIIHAVFTEMPQKRELLNEITENSKTAIVVTDKNTHELLYLNKAAGSVMEARGGEYSGRKCYEYLCGRESECPNCARLLEAAYTGELVDLYSELWDSYLLIRCRITEWAGHEARIEYFLDVTAARRAEQRLQELAQNVSCGLSVSAAHAPAYKIEPQYINDGLCRLLGKTQPEALKLAAQNVLCCEGSENMALVRKTEALIRKGAEADEAVYTIRLPDGTLRWIKAAVKIITQRDCERRIYTTFFDITKQKLQEEQLKNVIKNVPGGICLYRCDGKNYYPIVLSEHFSKLIGEKQDGVIDSTKAENFSHVHPEDRASLIEALERGLKTGGLTHTYRIFNKNTEKLLWIQLRSTAISQKDGTYLVYINFTDITEERQTAERLRASESALDAATRHAGLWYWEFDRKTERATFSRGCMKDFRLPAVMENYPEPWLARCPMSKLFMNQFLEAVGRIKAGENHVVFEIQAIFNDTAHWIEIRFNCLETVGCPSDTVVCTARIIDELKALQARYELELQKPTLNSEKLLAHGIFNIRTGATIDYATKENKENGIADCPTLFYLLAEGKPDIIGAKAQQQFKRWNDRAFLIEQARRGNLDFSMEYRRRIADGSVIWVRNLFHIVTRPDTMELYLFEYCYDIHEQKMIEEALKAAVTRDYERVMCVNFHTDRAMVIGALQYYDRDYESSYEEIRHIFASSVVMPEERESFLKETEPSQVARKVSQSGSCSFLVRGRRPDGTGCICKIRFLDYDAENGIYFLTRSDVTSVVLEEEKKNKRLKEALSVAQQANGAKTDFLSAMSHDIRTPMNAIVGMCELALVDEENRAQVHESLQTIRSSSQLLLVLINNILDMSRIESGKMILNEAPFSLSTQVNETAKSYYFLARQKKLLFKVELDIKNDNCCGDIARIHSAIDNILANAIKYTTEGGSVTYKVSEEPSKNQGIGLYRFEITDTGIGISEEDQKHIFDPFYRCGEQTVSAAEGSGLGLSITKAIVELKGGTIALTSREGQGTTFVIELPLHYSSAEIKLPEKETEKSATFKGDLSGIRVLLCEDHPVNQKVLARLLENGKAEVTIAEDGQKGLELFANSSAGTYSIILMDIRMPRMNGFEATKAIRNSSHPQAASIPIVALSANAFAEDVQKSLANGMNAHLSKPVERIQLYSTILKYADRKKTAGAENAKEPQN